MISTAVVRPRPDVRPSASSRIITDMTGRKVPVQLPFRGIGMTWGSSLREFYTVTRSPESVLAAWPFAQLEARGTVLGELFPRALNRTEFWESSKISNGQGPNANVESLLKTNASLFLGYSNMAPLIDQVGLPFAGSVLILREELLFPEVRMVAGSMGQVQHGEELIERYHRDFADLAEELRPEAIVHKPRILMVTIPSRATRQGTIGFGGRINKFWSTMFARTAVTNAVDDSDWLIRRNAYSSGVEPLLIFDPDIIILTDGLYETPRDHPLGPQEFISDPRFRAMRAVRERRVYRYPHGFTVNMFGIIETPLAARWLAEIAHPDVLKPRTRMLVRQRLQDDLNMNLTDSQLDEMLSVNENRGMLHAARFEAPSAVTGVAQ